nr:MAG: nonstructural protein 1 [Densovirinae sp.]QJI53761.1 MAG: hypothetical protein [Densovirinae sp.]
MKIRTQKQSRLRLAILPTRTMQDSDSDEPSTTSPSPVNHQTCHGTSFKLCNSSGPSLDLETTRKLRSAKHQNRVKSAGMQIAIRLVYKYHIRSVSEFFDKTQEDEYAELVYQDIKYPKYIQPAIDLYIKDNIEIQRRDRWEYLLAFSKYNYQEEAELLRLFATQRINVIDFARNLKTVLNCEHPKINMIKMWGAPNTGKSLIARLITENFITCFACMKNSENEFSMSNFLNKAVILCDELYITRNTIEDYKIICSGAPHDLSKKFYDKQLLCRTPMIVTSNYCYYGRGHLPPVDEEALCTRAITYNFDSVFQPNVMITAPSFAHLMWAAANQDIL